MMLKVDSSLLILKSPSSHKMGDKISKSDNTQLKDKCRVTCLSAPQPTLKRKSGIIFIGLNYNVKIAVLLPIFSER